MPDLATVSPPAIPAFPIRLPSSRTGVVPRLRPPIDAIGGWAAVCRKEAEPFESRGAKPAVSSSSTAGEPTERAVKVVAALGIDYEPDRDESVVVVRPRSVCREPNARNRAAAQARDLNSGVFQFDR